MHHDELPSRSMVQQPFQIRLAYCKVPYFLLHINNMIKLKFIHSIRCLMLKCSAWYWVLISYSAKGWLRWRSPPIKTIESSVQEVAEMLNLLGIYIRTGKSTSTKAMRILHYSVPFRLSEYNKYCIQRSVVEDLPNKEQPTDAPNDCKPSISGPPTKRERQYNLLIFETCLRSILHPRKQTLRIAANTSILPSNGRCSFYATVVM